MKVFVYGCRILDMDAIRWHFGKNEYIDVTNQYQDVLALNADMVLVSISKAEYDKYVALGKYDRVSVDWHKEAIKDRCLENLFYNRTDISELPPILKPLKELLDTYTEPFKYAWFGED